MKHRPQDCPNRPESVNGEPPEEVEKLGFGHCSECAAHDPVDHPSHYTFGRFEVIDVIEDWSPHWRFPFHRGNAIKYLARAGIKDSGKTVEDLEKAIWYVEREIELLNKEKDVVKERLGAFVKGGV